MRKLTIAAVILLVMGALVAFALMNLDSLVKRNKDYILTQAEQALGRKVAIEDIGVTVWGGIGVRLKNFALADDPAFSREESLRAADLQVNVKLLPLLWKEVKVTRLILHEPVIRVIRNKRGELNFASLAGPREAKPKAKAPPAAPPATAALLVSRVKVDDGDIHYLDKKEGVDLRVKQIDVTVTDLGFDRAASLDLAAAVLADKQNVRVRAQVGPPGPALDMASLPVEGEIEISSLNIDALQRMVPQVKQRLPQGLGLSGPLQAKLALSRKGETLTLSRVEFSTAVFGADRPNLEVRGRVGPVGQKLEDASLKGTLTLGPVALANLVRFAPVAQALPKELSVDGPVSLSADVDGTVQNLKLNGKVEATEGTIRLGERFHKPRGTALVLSTDAQVTQQQIALKKATVKLHTLELTGTGTMSRGKTPGLRLEIDSNRADLDGWEKILPMLQGYNLAGTAELRTRIQGEIKPDRIPDVNGSLTLTRLRAAVPQVPQPLTAQTATVTFTGQRAAFEETAFRVGKSEIRLASTVEKFTPLTLTYRLSSPELWVADIREGRAPTKKPEVLREVKSDGRAWQEKGSLVYRGQFSSTRGTIADVDYTQLQGRVSMADQVVTIESFALRAYNGSLQGSGRYDMGKTPPQFSVTAQGRDMAVAEFFHSASTGAAKYIRGGVDLDLKLAGSGNQWQDIQRNLTGQGQAEVVKGALRDVNIAESALTGLTGVPGLTFFISPKTRDKYPAIFATRNTEFGQLKGSVNIEGGKVHLDNLLIAAGDWAVGGKGWVTLDQMLDLRGQLVLSPQLSTDLIRDAKPLKYLADQQGRLTIPFTLAGTLPGVKPKPDVDYVARLVQRGLVERGVEELTKGLLRKPSAPSPPAAQKEPAPPQETTEPQKKKPEEELLKGLKQLFGR